MLGALALIVVLAGAGGVGWILYFLYGPRLGRRTAMRAPLPGRVILEPMFAAQPRPSAPRTRMARGTGGVPNKVPAREEITDKVVARYP